MFRYFNVIGALVCFLFILSGCGNSPNHTITGFNCSGASAGSPIVIFGTGFDSNGSNNMVAFTGAGGTPIIVQATSGLATLTTLGVTVPAGATTGPIMTSTDGGPEVTSPTSFTVLPQPTFSPASGPVNTVITITGTNFDPSSVNNAVYFNGTPAVVTSSSPTQIVTTVPANATTGVITINVGVNTYILTSASSFSVSQ